MRIVHLDLAGFYTENTLYQTNQLARFNLRDGHEVTVISTAYRWEGAEIVKVPPCDMFVEGGVRRIQENPALLEALREGSRRYARELLDYRKLAARLYGNAAGEGGLKTAKEDELMNAGHADTAATPISRQRTAPPGLVIYGNSFSRLNAAPGRKISRFSVAFPAPRNERTESGVPSRPAPAPQIGGARP